MATLKYTYNLNKQPSKFGDIHTGTVVQYSSFVSAPVECTVVRLETTNREGDLEEDVRRVILKSSSDSRTLTVLVREGDLGHLFKLPDSTIFPITSAMEKEAAEVDVAVSDAAKSKASSLFVAGTDGFRDFTELLSRIGDISDVYIMDVRHNPYSVLKRQFNIRDIKAEFGNKYSVMTGMTGDTVARHIENLIKSGNKVILLGDGKAGVDSEYGPVTLLSSDVRDRIKYITPYDRIREPKVVPLKFGVDPEKDIHERIVSSLRAQGIKLTSEDEVSEDVSSLIGRIHALAMKNLDELPIYGEGDEFLSHSSPLRGNINIRALLGLELAENRRSVFGVEKVLRIAAEPTPYSALNNTFLVDTLKSLREMPSYKDSDVAKDLNRAISMLGPSPLTDWGGRVEGMSSLRLRGIGEALRTSGVIRLLQEAKGVHGDKVSEVEGIIEGYAQMLQSTPDSWANKADTSDEIMNRIPVNSVGRTAEEVKATGKLQSGSLAADEGFLTPEVDKRVMDVLNSDRITLGDFFEGIKSGVPFENLAASLTMGDTDAVKTMHSLFVTHNENAAFKAHTIHGKLVEAMESLEEANALRAEVNYKRDKLLEIVRKVQEAGLTDGADSSAVMSMVASPQVLSSYLIDSGKRSGVLTEEDQRVIEDVLAPEFLAKVGKSKLLGSAAKVHSIVGPMLFEKMSNIDLEDEKRAFERGADYSSIQERTRRLGFGSTLLDVSNVFHGDETAIVSVPSVKMDDKGISLTVNLDDLRKSLREGAPEIPAKEDVEFKAAMFSPEKKIHIIGGEKRSTEEVLNMLFGDKYDRFMESGGIGNMSFPIAKHLSQALNWRRDANIDDLQDSLQDAYVHARTVLLRKAYASPTLYGATDSLAAEVTKDIKSLSDKGGRLQAVSLDAPIVTKTGDEISLEEVIAGPSNVEKEVLEGSRPSRTPAVWSALKQLRDMGFLEGVKDEMTDEEAMTVFKNVLLSSAETLCSGKPDMALDSFSKLGLLKYMNNIKLTSENQLEVNFPDWRGVNTALGLLGSAAPTRTVNNMVGVLITVKGENKIYLPGTDISDYAHLRENEGALVNPVVIDETTGIAQGVHPFSTRVSFEQLLKDSDTMAITTDSVSKELPLYKTNTGVLVGSDEDINAQVGRLRDLRESKGPMLALDIETYGDNYERIGQIGIVKAENGKIAPLLNITPESVKKELEEYNLKVKSGDIENGVLEPTDAESVERRMVEKASGVFEKNKSAPILIYNQGADIEKLQNVIRKHVESAGGHSEEYLNRLMGGAGDEYAKYASMHGEWIKERRSLRSKMAETIETIRKGDRRLEEAHRRWKGADDLAMEYNSNLRAQEKARAAGERVEGTANYNEEELDRLLAQGRKEYGRYKPTRDKWLKEKEALHNKVAELSNAVGKGDRELDVVAQGWREKFGSMREYGSKLHAQKKLLEGSEGVVRDLEDAKQRSIDVMRVVMASDGRWMSQQRLGVEVFGAQYKEEHGALQDAADMAAIVHKKYLGGEDILGDLHLEKVPLDEFQKLTFFGKTSRKTTSNVGNYEGYRNESNRFFRVGATYVEKDVPTQQSKITMSLHGVNSEGEVGRLSFGNSAEMSDFFQSMSVVNFNDEEIGKYQKDIAKDLFSRQVRELYSDGRNFGHLEFAMLASEMPDEKLAALKGAVKGEKQLAIGEVDTEVLRALSNLIHPANRGEKLTEPELIRHIQALGDNRSKGVEGNKALKVIDRLLSDSRYREQFNQGRSWFNRQYVPHDKKFFELVEAARTRGDLPAEYVPHVVSARNALMYGPNGVAPFGTMEMAKPFNEVRVTPRIPGYENSYSINVLFGANKDVLNPAATENDILNYSTNMINRILSAEKLSSVEGGRISPEDEAKLAGMAKFNRERVRGALMEVMTPEEIAQFRSKGRWASAAEKRTAIDAVMRHVNNLKTLEGETSFAQAILGTVKSTEKLDNVRDITTALLKGAAADERLFDGTNYLNVSGDEEAMRKASSQLNEEFSKLSPQEMADAALKQRFRILGENSLRGERLRAETLPFRNEATVPKNILYGVRHKIQFAGLTPAQLFEKDPNALVGAYMEHKSTVGSQMFNEYQAHETERLLGWGNMPGDLQGVGRHTIIPVKSSEGISSAADWLLPDRSSFWDVLKSSQTADSALDKIHRAFNYQSQNVPGPVLRAVSIFYGRQSPLNPEISAAAEAMKAVRANQIKVNPDASADKLAEDTQNLVNSTLKAAASGRRPNFNLKEAVEDDLSIDNNNEGASRSESFLNTVPKYAHENVRIIVNGVASNDVNLPELQQALHNTVTNPGMRNESGEITADVAQYLTDMGKAFRRLYR